MIFSDYESIKDLTGISQNAKLGQRLTQQGNLQQGIEISIYRWLKSKAVIWIILRIHSLSRFKIRITSSTSCLFSMKGVDTKQQEWQLEIMCTILKTISLICFNNMERKMREIVQGENNNVQRRPYAVKIYECSCREKMNNICQTYVSRSKLSMNRTFNSWYWND